MEGDRSDDVGVQAAQGRQVPRRQRLHRRRRRRVDRARAEGAEQPVAVHRLHEADRQDRRRRPLHDPLQDGAAVSADAVRHDADRDHLASSSPSASTDDFNTGKAAIGTGPYKLARYAKGDRIELARNDAWWGGKTPWEKVTLRILTQDAARVAALLSGDVQVDRERADADVAQAQGGQAPRDLPRRSPTGSCTCIWTATATSRRPSPPKDGKPLDEESAQGRARAQGAVEDDQPAGDRRARDGRRGDAGGPARRPTSCSARRRTSRSRSSIPRARRSCSRRPAIRTASSSRCTRRTTATSTTPRSRRRSRRCGRAPASTTKVVAMPSATFFPQATDLKFSVHARRLEHGHRRIVVVAEGAADDVQQGQGLRHRQPRPLLERQGRRADRGRAA